MWDVTSYLQPPRSTQQTSLNWLIQQSRPRGSTVRRILLVDCSAACDVIVIRPTNWPIVRNTVAIYGVNFYKHRHLSIISFCKSSALYFSRLKKRTVVTNNSSSLVQTDDIAVLTRSYCYVSLKVDWSCLTNEAVRKRRPVRHVRSWL